MYRLNEIFFFEMVNKKIYRGKKEKIVKYSLFIFAFSSIMILLLIVIFLFREGYPIFVKMGVKEFLFGEKWKPKKDVYGALPFIVTSVIVTFGALSFAIPLGIASAIMLSEIAGSEVKALLRPLIELLAGIPSIVYGFFGLMLIANIVQRSFDLPTGECLFTGSLILGVMALPLIISISQDAMESVPKEYREASLALGATEWQTISKIVIPCAFRGILASVILAMGRAIGETMAVVLVLGNVEKLPTSIFDPAEALTSAILLEMAEAVVGSTHYQALFGLGIILFFITLFLRLVSEKIMR